MGGPETPISSGVASPLMAVLPAFAEFLDRRLAKGVFTTEDSVRYTFFWALSQTLKLAPEEIILEHPHPRITRAEIDTYIPDLGGRAFAIEFKYDRENPAGRIRRDRKRLEP